MATRMDTAAPVDRWRYTGGVQPARFFQFIVDTAFQNLEIFGCHLRTGRFGGLPDQCFLPAFQGARFRRFAGFIQCRLQPSHYSFYRWQTIKRFWPREDSDTDLGVGVGHYSTSDDLLGVSAAGA